MYSRTVRTGILKIYFFSKSNLLQKLYIESRFLSPEP